MVPAGAGASSNRKFFASHAIEEHKKSGVTFKARNIALPGNFVYFMCDVPHLMKTTRNTWNNSTANGRGTVLLNICYYVNIDRIMARSQLAEKCWADSALYIGNKLKREHVFLTSYSRMTVRLATQVLFLKVLFATWVICKRQVLNLSVHNAFKTPRMYGIMKDTKETLSDV